MAESQRRILAVVLLAALAVRLGWGLTRPTDAAAIEQLPDQREYLDVARSFLAGEGFSFTDPRFAQRVYAHRTPGYPMLIAACGANVTAVRIVQALLDTSTVLAIYLLARRWLPAYVSLFAALLVAANPFLIYFSGLLLTETLFTAMLNWGMLLLTARRTVPWLAGGALLALSVLVRPGAIGMPVLIGVLAAMASAGASAGGAVAWASARAAALSDSPNRDIDPPYHRRWPIPVGTTMLLFTLLALLPWAIRNHRVIGRWVWTSTNDGITRYDGFNPDSAAKDWPHRGESDQSFVSAMPHIARMSETDRNDYLAAQAGQFVRDRPGDAVKLAGAKALRTWSPRPLSETFSRPAYVAAAMGYAVPFLLLFACGLVFAPMPKPVKLLLAVPAMYLTLTVALSVGSLRYRIPAEPPMAVIAAGVLAAGGGAAGAGSREARRADDDPGL